MPDSRARARKMHNEPRAPWSPRKEVLKYQKHGDVPKEHRSQHERAPGDQIGAIRDNLSNNTNNTELDFNGKYKINIHESVLVLVC